MKQCSSNYASAIVTLLLAIVAVAPCPAAVDVAEWYPGSSWQVRTDALTTGPMVQPGTYLDSTELTTLHLLTIGPRLQDKTSRTYDVYVLNTQGTTSFTGNFVMDYDVYPVRVRNASINGQQWIRRSDLADVRIETHTSGRLEVYAFGSWIDLGAYSVNQYQEFDPPRENLDFPLEVGETWSQEFTTYLWGDVNMPGVGYDTINEQTTDVLTQNCSAMEVKNSVNSYRVETQYQGISGTITNWYSPAHRFITESLLIDVPIGENTIAEGSSRVTAVNLAPGPGLTIDPLPASVPMAGQVLLTGATIQAGINVTVTFPDAGLGTASWSTTSNPNYSLTITAPAGGDDTPQLGADPDDGSHGLVVVAAEDSNGDGHNDHRVLTLTLRGDGPTPTPTPPATPTATPAGPTIDLTLSATAVYANDPFYLLACIRNQAPSHSDLDIYIVMEYAGLYFFYPSWSEGIDQQALSVSPFSTINLTILNFTWPAGTGSGGPVLFYGVLANRGTLDFLCPLDSVQFNFY
ncbi:hypothetical protein JW905_01300 [bacterium]|nr:hypothetical protein [candidate division CSSED10-310 bacterium]